MRGFLLNMAAIAETLREQFNNFKIERPSFVFPKEHGDYHPLLCFFTDIRYTVPHAVLNYLITTFDSSLGMRQTYDSFVRGTQSVTDRLRGEPVTAVRSAVWDRAERAWNGLRKKLIEPETKLGQITDWVYNSMENFHHGHPHSRRFEDIAEFILLNTPDFFLTHDLIEAFAGVPYNHDQAQGLRHYWNRTENLSLDEKTGHDWEGAGMVLAQFEDLAKEKHISPPKAFRLAALTALIILPHGNPEKLKKVLEATIDGFLPKYQKDNTNGKINEDLWQDFKEGKIDITTLSAYQLMQIIKRNAKETGRLDAQIQGKKSRYGMFPHFEEKYEKVIEMFLTDPKYKKPLFPHLSKKENQAFKNAVLLNTFIDMLDMVTPFDESFLRKLNVKKAKDRDIFSGDAKSILDWVKSKDNDKVNQNDTARTLFEIMHLGDLIKDTDLEKNRLIREMVGKTAMASLLSFARIGKKIMRGEVGVVSEIYERRIKTMGIKLLRRAGVSGGNYDSLSQEEIQCVLDGKDEKFATRFQEATNFLRQEEKETIKSIKGKPENKNADSIHQYSEKEILEFGSVCSEVKIILKTAYGFSDDDIKTMETMLDNHGDVPIACFSYDTTSNGNAIRTWIEH